MSTFFLVYHDEEDKPYVTEQFEQAMWEFLRGALNGDPVTLKYSP